MTVVAISLLLSIFCASYFSYEINYKKFGPYMEDFYIDPDLLRNVSELITSKGYPVENHHVQTQDGFILGVQRIPSGRRGRSPLIFLQHGLLSAASDWVINFPEQSLGFILADLGYDVWLGNTRGNTYSRRHVKYTPDMHAFWDFCFDDMAKYDLPAMIDYALNVTGEKSLYYVGHSQGTTAMFALLSESPEFNEKIKLFVALAPVATVGYITSGIKYLAPFTRDIEFLFELLGVNEFLPSNALMRYLSEFVCDTSARFLCEDVKFLLMGADIEQLNETRLGVYSAHSPAGSSTKSIIHYAQMVNSKTFVKFDYGEKENLIRYNQTSPPEYDVSQISASVALLWGLNDRLADPTDVQLLIKRLSSTDSTYCVPWPKFNHDDFVLAMDAKKLLYNEVVTLLKRFDERLARPRRTI